MFLVKTIPLELILFLKNWKSFNHCLDNCNPLTLFDKKLKLEVLNTSSFLFNSLDILFDNAKRRIKYSQKKKLMIEQCRVFLIWN